MQDAIRLLLSSFLLLFTVSCASLPSTHSEPEAAIARVLDSWHHAAAVADENVYFDLMAPDAVFLGTDATERWTKSEFIAWSARYFARESAWRFDPIERHVTVAPGGESAWFDERLMSASYGECRGSGALTRTTAGWKIAHYNLTIPIPNEIANEVVGMIRRLSDAK